MAMKQDAYDALAHQHGAWVASMLDGWLCPQVYGDCDGDHAAGNCAAARAEGAAIVAAKAA